jgi:hypothetical protein
MRRFLRVGGAANVLAGVLLSTFWILYALALPYSQLDDTLAILPLDEDWLWVNSIGVAGALAGVLGLPALYLARADRLGAWGLTGFLLALAGSAGLLGPLLWDTILWGTLAQADPHLLDFDGPIYRSGLFLGFYAGAGLAYSAGFALFGAVLSRDGAKAGLLIAIGAPLFGLGSLFGDAQVLPRTVGVLLFGAGLCWLGSTLMGPGSRSTR